MEERCNFEPSTMENQSSICPDSTVRSQDSNNSEESKVSKESNESRDSKTESCLESKHSKDALIPDRPSRHQPSHSHQEQHIPKHKSRETKDDSNILMFASCGQLLLGVVLVVFGVLVLVHGAALGSSGAGLWAGAGALVAGALGVVATLATSNGSTSGFSTAHLASSLVALALSNMAAITALTAVVRDSQRTPELTLLADTAENEQFLNSDGGWAGILASVGLLLASVAELLVSGYTCVSLTPKLCSCLRRNDEDDQTDGRLKTRNMVHQWVIAQNHVPKNQPIYVVQPVMPMHPMMQPPFGIHPPAKYAGGFLPGTLPIAAPGYGPVPILPHMAYPPSRPHSQMMRSKQKRQHVSSDREDSIERHRRQSDSKNESKKMSSIGEDQVDLAQTYTGLDKKISEEFISIAMDPDRKSRASSHHGSEYEAQISRC